MMMLLTDQEYRELQFKSSQPSLEEAQKLIHTYNERMEGASCVFMQEIMPLLKLDDKSDVAKAQAAFAKLLKSIEVTYHIVENDSPTPK